MKYREMTKFLNDIGILAMQPVIANYLDAQLETDISDDEFEEICEEVFDCYLGSIEEPDIWRLIDKVLKDRELKEE